MEQKEKVLFCLCYTESMPKVSAGLLLYRMQEKNLEVFLVHPGGPFWTKKDSGAWSIPKGEVEQEQASEDYLETAKREFEEELGLPPPQGAFISLGPVEQKSGKIVHAWAIEGNCDPAAIKSNTFAMEWPPRSAREQEFPEVDRAAFFTIDEAKQKINPRQIDLLVRLEEKIKNRQ